MVEERMSAVRLHAPGDPARLRLERIPTPRPQAGEVLVRVHAAAITRGELEWPEDRLPATPSYELSGLVVATGPGVEHPRIGDEVYALSGFDRDGAAAEYAVVSEATVAAKPRTLDHVESAALPLAGLSAWQGLFEHGRLEPGQHVLIHGGAGCVGALAVQLARARGARVTATASPPNLDAVRKLGADVIDHTSARFEEAVEQVDLVFDTVGGERLERSPAVIKDGGRLISIAAEPAPGGEERGVTGRYFVVEPNQAQLVELAKLADAGELRIEIDRSYPLADAQRAFERSLDRASRGKVVLRIGEA
jgi:NADPH:quinone reductase-like Zn-dependent oxidoreductase